MTQSLPGSFRDHPAGYLFVREGRLYRQVNQSFSHEYERFLHSGLYEELASEALIVPHQEVDIEPSNAEAYKVLEPCVVPFISYPYEWCFSQLRDAALLTIDLQRRALRRGMLLRDASAFNVQFNEGRPVFIDTLSFGSLEPDAPWIAYRQFCQHFLAPLALMRYRDWRAAQLMRAYIDGIPLDLASALLPRRTWFRPGIVLHVHMHARSAGRRSVRDRSRAFGVRAHEGLVESLAALVRGLEQRSSGSSWSDYYEKRESYSDEAMEHKTALVRETLAQAQPEHVWDFGANVGVFSSLAAQYARRVTAFEADPMCVEGAYRRYMQEGEKRVLPLVMDLTNPSPALGWAHEERMSLGQRGPADLVLALALIHHLAISNNVPFGPIANFFATVAEHLVIEFVPKSDPMVQRLLSTRLDIFDGYNQDQFELSFSEHFKIERRDAIRGSERTLYLMSRRHARQ